MMYERDYNNDMYYSRKEGMEEGIAMGKEEEKLANAKSLKLVGVPVEKISQALGLTVEQVQAL